jgi:membrane-bound lytic murein transglycosylase D
MQDQDSPLIARHEQWYAARPDYIARMMSRANRYLYYITAEVERRGMPSEIALLPMIESAFNPGAYSTSSASGIWQFMPGTGKKFGMRQNWWYDGRRDIIGATNGALDYLEKLHQIFGDWELALAAYNWGDGAVLRAQARNRKNGLPVDYASLKLPDETRNYVPKLLAMKHIIAEPERFALTLPAIPNKPYFAQVPTEKHIDVELVAQLAEISTEEFTALNPAHNRPVILQDNSNYILLPIDKVDTFRTNLENYDAPLVSWHIYHSKKGERLDHLAPRFGLSLEKLKSVNSLSERSRTSTGETLLVPFNGETDEDEGDFEAVNMHLHPLRNESAPALKYTVHSGDTLDKLAARYHVSVATLRAWNGQLRTIKTGQQLTVAESRARKEHLKSSHEKTTKHARGTAHRQHTGKHAAKSLHSGRHKAGIRSRKR